MKLTRTCSLYFMVLSLVYLLQAFYCYVKLDREKIAERHSNEDYGDELFNFVSTVCLINIVHALTLISLAVFVVILTRRFKILNEKHYL